MNIARSALVIIFLFLGAVFAFTANATVWANRTVFDTDNFVETANRALDDEEVQQQLATRLSVTLVEEGQVQERLRERLPDGLQFLAPILTVTARNLTYDIILRLLNNDTVRDALDTALTLVHQQVMKIIEDEGAVVIEDNKVVLDLGVILQRAAEELNAGGNGFIENLNLPEDAGQVVLIEDASTAESLQTLLSLHQTITWAVIGLSIGAFALAVAVAKDRRRTFRNVGIVLIVSGVLAITVLLGIRPVAAGFAQNPDAARAALDAFLWDYRLQSFVLVFLGVGIVLIAFMTGNSRLAKAVRGTVRPQEGAPESDLRGAIKGSGTPLRVFGLVLAALVLAAWPEPSTRVYVTTFGMLALYLLGLWIITSDSEWAGNAREKSSEAWGRVGGSDDPRNATLVGRHVNQFRIAGIVLAVIGLILVPNLGIGAFVAIVAITLVYLALIDWLATRPEEET